MVLKEKTLESLRGWPVLRRKEANYNNPVSYSKVIKIEGDYIRRTPFEAEDHDECEDFDVKKYKIAGDLGNTRISIVGIYSNYVTSNDDDYDDDYDDDDYDDEPRAQGRFISDSELASIIDASVARALKQVQLTSQNIREVAVPREATRTEQSSQPWLSTISV